MDEGINNKSLFNAGVAKLMRIDKIKTALVQANLDDNEFVRLSLLESFRTEMEERLSEEEKEACDKYENRISSLLGLNSSVKLDKTILDRELTRYERYLNTLEYKYGYSMPDAENAGAVLR